MFIVTVIYFLNVMNKKLLKINTSIFMSSYIYVTIIIVLLMKHSLNIDQYMSCVLKRSNITLS